MTHLKTRSEAIKAAIKTYNDAAGAARPKRKKLKAEDVLQYNHIGQFAVLRDTRNEITEKAWAVPANRIARDAWFKTERAKEEIIRVEVEVARLRSWMDMEEALYSRVLKEAESSDKDLAGELARRTTRLHRAHRKMRDDLDRISTIYQHRPSFVYKGNEARVRIQREAEEESDDNQDDDEEGKQAEIDNFLEGIASLDSLG